MRHDFIDRFSRIDSPIHRLSTALKVIFTFSAIILTVSIPNSFLLYDAVCGLFLIIIAFASRIPKLFLLKRLLLFEPFVISVSIISLLQPGGGMIFMMVVLKSTLCLAMMILLSNTTPFSELLNFMTRLRLPALLVTILALLYRYLFVLIDETEKMQRARESRTFKLKQTHVWKMRATLIAQLFTRSTERAERIYSAMRARGWK